MTTLVLADKHPIIRLGLKTLLESQGDITVVGETDDGLEALRLVETVQPDIVILDLALSGLNGMEVTRQIQRRGLRARVVVFGVCINEAYFTQAMRHGAQAFLQKEISPDELVLAVRKTLAGERYVSAPFAEVPPEVATPRHRDTHLDPYESLTSREREVVQLVAEGHSNSHISTRLNISPRTVEVHRANVMRKLNFQSQTELIRYALRRGIIQY